MYIDVILRTQIYLDKEEIAALDAAERQSGANRSELIRRAIRAQYGQLDPSDRSAALEASSGAWSGREGSGARRIDELRRDADIRVALRKKT